MLDTEYVDDVVLVSEPDTIRACRRLGRRGFLFGGSTGTVVAGAERWLAEHGDSSLTAVGIAPDLGGGYLDTIYDDEWVADHVKEPGASTAGGVAASNATAWRPPGAELSTSGSEPPPARRPPSRRGQVACLPHPQCPDQPPGVVRAGGPSRDLARTRCP